MDTEAWFAFLSAIGIDPIRRVTFSRLVRREKWNFPRSFETSWGLKIATTENRVGGLKISGVSQ